MRLCITKTRCQVTVMMDSRVPIAIVNTVTMNNWLV